MTEVAMAEAVLPAAQDQATPIASTSRHGLCSVCSSQSAKYTCPRCSIKTCSLVCTKSHKAVTSCSGERDRVSFVGMNQYGDVGMWRDLSYLRDVKTKVGEWGKQAASNSNNAKMSYKGKERERDSQVLPERLLNLTDKEQRLKKQMILRGIEVLFLPKEMERHRQNTSNYLHKKRKLHITVSVISYDHEGKRHHTSTTHHRELSTALQDLVAAVPLDDRPGGPEETYTILLAVPSRPTTYIPPNAQPIVPDRVGPKKKEEKGLAPAHSTLPARPAWVPELPVEEPVVLPDLEMKEEDPPAPQLFSPARQVWQVTLHNGESATTLQQALKGTSIVEWPEFELWPSSLVKKLVDEGKLEFMARRDAETRTSNHSGGDQGWGGRKRTNEEVDQDDGVQVEEEELDLDGDEGDLEALQAALESDNLHLASQTNAQQPDQLV